MILGSPCISLHFGQLCHNDVVQSISLHFGQLCHNDVVQSTSLHFGQLCHNDVGQSISLYFGQLCHNDVGQPIGLNFGQLCHNDVGQPVTHEVESLPVHDVHDRCAAVLWVVATTSVWLWFLEHIACRVTFLFLHWSYRGMHGLPRCTPISQQLCDKTRSEFSHLLSSIEKAVIHYEPYEW